jgi:hypothetical protein
LRKSFLRRLQIAFWEILYMEALGDFVRGGLRQLWRELVYGGFQKA